MGVLRVERLGFLLVCVNVTYLSPLLVLRMVVATRERSG